MRHIHTDPDPFFGATTPAPSADTKKTKKTKAKVPPSRRARDGIIGRFVI